MIRPVPRARLQSAVVGVSSAAFLLLFAAVPSAAAHGLGDHLPPLDLGSALTTWAFDPLLTAALFAAAALYLVAVGLVDRRHPASPVPWRRPLAWLAGLLGIAVALESSIDVYAEALFSVHMAQHLMLIAIVAPLLALSAPVTLLLRVASPGARNGIVLPLLRSRPVALLTHPLVGWLGFAGVMWISHFSPLFDLSLENPLVHEGEHVLYLASAMLFWWPVVAADPIRHRLSWSARIVYLGSALPWNSFLGVAIYFAPAVLYHHYASVVRTWGPTPLLDQQIAGAVMWVGGDLAFLAALLLVVAGLLADEERKGRIFDARMDAARR
jgi:putative copper resistance protein D